MRKLKQLLAREDGIAMATVVAMIAILTVLSVTLIDQVTAESTRAANSVNSDAVYQAAEAGINDYVAKLLDDPQYYDHYVANGEATRTSCTTYSAGACTAFGSLVGSPGTAWTAGTHWGYNAGAPPHKDTWYQGTGNVFGNSTLLKGYAYDLMITPPSTSLGANYVTIVSTGCRLVAGSTTTCDSSASAPAPRTIEARVRRTTPADFFVMFNADQSFGSGYTNYGPIYVNGDIQHDGDAYGDIMAEGTISGSVVLHQKADGTMARKLTRSSNPNLSTVIKNPINFNNFAISLNDVKKAASLYSSGGVCSASGPACFTDAAAIAWSIVFLSNGTFQIKECKSGSDPGSSAPSNCGTTSTFSLPANGAIYTGQTALISWTSSSTVNGRVTVASNADIDIAGNIDYQSDHGGPNDDVLGLIANNNVYVTNYVPTNLSWRAAAIAENGSRRSYSCPNEGDGTKNSVTFRGSVASNKSGCMTLFLDRYNYADDTLKFLFPPWYPVIDGAESTVLFREVPQGYMPFVG